MSEQESHGRFYRVSEATFDQDAGLLPAHPALGAGHPRHHADGAAVTVALNVVLVIVIPKGFFPQQDTGCSPAACRGGRTPPLPAMDDSIRQIVGRDQGRSGRGQCHRLHRRRRHQHRHHLYRAQAAGAAQGQCRAGHQPPAAEAEPAAGGLGVSCRRSRICASAAARATPCTSTPCSRTTSTT